MMIEDIFLTQEGIDNIKKELTHLRGTVRSELAARLRAAIEMGDLSENADYSAAKEEQGFIEGRIQELEETLRRAKVIDKSSSNSDSIQLGSSVIIREEGAEESETYTIVGSKESDPASGKISYESPIGKALLTHHIGDIVRVETPGGYINFKIIEIK